MQSFDCPSTLNQQTNNTLERIQWGESIDGGALKSTKRFTINHFRWITINLSREAKAKGYFMEFFRPGILLYPIIKQYKSTRFGREKVCLSILSSK